MTKLHHIKGVEEEGQSGKRRGPGTLVVVVCALVSGIGLAIGFGVGGEGSAPPPFAQIALKVSTRLANVDLKAPPEVLQPMKDMLGPVQHAMEPVQHALQPVRNILGPVQLSLWPDWFPSLNQGTRYKAAGTFVSGKPTIALVIDDLGADEAHTKEAIALPSAVTLSFLPYPKKSFVLSHEAKEARHEVIVHLPMQPVGTENPGPNALMTNLSAAETERRLDWALAHVSDYDGANNHMGSRFTASRAALIPVMQQLSVRGLLFLDSRTTPDTQAEKVAHEAGMLTGSRDIFLDDEQTASGVEHQLAVAEDFARTHGTAIVIGHPHPETLAALKNWVFNVQARGFELQSLKTVLEMRASERTTQTASATSGTKAQR
ncbi:MAG TPA: divergent polysaccharide deacetylase family protein [Micropepsaceae bacterium]|nr:divergent polysaccharide deacetylase family protein [Micropepsaceae bacterium]